MGIPPLSPKRDKLRDMGRSSRSREADEAISIQGYGEFEVDIEKVMRAELKPRFEGLTAAPLTKHNIQFLPARAKGAYILYLDGKPVYAGKTDTKQGFRDRLLRHHFTLQHRQNIDLSHIKFKAVRVMVFSNFDVETILIEEMRRLDKEALPWNDSGFGSNDPGHNREREEPGEFDRKNPIDINMPLDGFPINSGKISILEAFLKLKEWLPYTFRWETDIQPNGKPAHWSKGHSDYKRESAVMTIPTDSLTTRGLLMEALRNLPTGWRVTVFPGRVIVYKEPASYPFALEHFEKTPPRD